VNCLGSEGKHCEVTFVSGSRNIVCMNVRCASRVSDV